MAGLSRPLLSNGPAQRRWGNGRGRAASSRERGLPLARASCWPPSGQGQCQFPKSASPLEKGEKTLCGEDSLSLHPKALSQKLNKTSL